MHPPAEPAHRRTFGQHCPLGSLQAHLDHRGTQWIRVPLGVPNFPAMEEQGSIPRFPSLPQLGHLRVHAQLDGPAHGHRQIIQQILQTGMNVDMGGYNEIFIISLYNLFYAFFMGFCVLGVLGVLGAGGNGLEVDCSCSMLCSHLCLFSNLLVWS